MNFIQKFFVAVYVVLYTAAIVGIWELGKHLLPHLHVHWK